MTDEEYDKHFNKYKKICNGCIKENCGICKHMDVILCYLYSTLPNGVIIKAVENDCYQSLCDKIKEYNDKEIIRLAKDFTNSHPHPKGIG